jgi:hypothetical protein
MSKIRMNKSAALILLVLLAAWRLFGANTAQSKRDEEAWRARRTAALLAAESFTGRDSCGRKEIPRGIERCWDQSLLLQSVVLNQYVRRSSSQSLAVRE